MRDRAIALKRFGLRVACKAVWGVLIQRLLLCTHVTEEDLRFALRRRDLFGAEQVREDASVEIVQIDTAQYPCFLGQNVRFNKLTIRDFEMSFDQSRRVRVHGPHRKSMVRP